MGWRKIWQSAAKTYESCSTGKMANILNYLLSLATRVPLLSKHVWQTKETARKEQRKAALSKKAVTLPLPWSSTKNARLCSHNMLTCASAATTAAHHRGHACVWMCVFACYWDTSVCFLSQSLNLFSSITSFSADDGCSVDAPSLRGLLILSKSENISAINLDILNESRCNERKKWKSETETPFTKRHLVVYLPLSKILHYWQNKLTLLANRSYNLSDPGSYVASKDKSKLGNTRAFPWSQGGQALEGETRATAQ